jgi:hypothetical protein
MDFLPTRGSLHAVVEQKLDHHYHRYRFHLHHLRLQSDVQEENFHQCMELAQDCIPGDSHFLLPSRIDDIRLSAN